MSKLPEKVVDELRIAATLLSEHTDDWMEVKILLIRYLPPALRGHLSTKNPISKKAYLNQFERDIIEEYHNITGVWLRIKEK